MLHRSLEHRFVEHAPQSLEPGVLYISMEFATAMHLCCCGCSREVVTPFSPTDWKLIFDGETVSLTPSVGNWNFPCRSHYIIRRSRVIEAESWTDEMVQAEQRRDKSAKSRHFGGGRLSVETQPVARQVPPGDDQSTSSREPKHRSLWRWMLGR
jgi:hypothetical protein